MLASNYPLLDVFVSTLYFALFIFWMILVFHIVLDIFSSHDLGGPAKALWVLFILVLPVLGCLVYLLARGGAMHLRRVQAVQSQQKAFEDYIRAVASTKE
ncbi:MAG TPA: PLD nuclease N-terminal domain-containing protein [Acidimicrobiales bacterium]|nr:PLD nuclease N-terminal domain-containing protein [Acidimicrobiales bacterium]